jgi:aryl-alcohol dehydrogenase-like predicted oxidoreductase
VAKILAIARADGISFIDTARSYGDSERLIGELAGGDPYWTVATKLDPDLGDDSDCSESNLGSLVERAEGSLARSRELLRLESIPIVLLHRMQHRWACSGRIWETLRRQRSAGAIGRLGISAATPGEATLAIEDHDVEVIQVPANLADQRLVQNGFFDHARRRGVFVVVRSAFLQGALTLAPENLPRHLEALGPFLRALDEQAESAGASRAELAFAHVSRLADVVVVGCETDAQLKENLAAWRRSASVTDPGPALADLARQLPEEVVEPGRWPR